MLIFCFFEDKIMANNGPNAAQGPILQAVLVPPPAALQAAAAPVVPPVAPVVPPAAPAPGAGEPPLAGAPPLAPQMEREEKLRKEKEWFDKWQKEFKQKAFAAEGWSLKGDPQKDKKFVWEKAGSNLNVTIQISDSEDPNFKVVSFSGTAHHEIAAAAMHYSKKMGDESKTIKFVVEAGSEEDAEKFIKNLANENFDLDLIKDFKINNNKKGPEFTEQLIAKVKEGVKAAKEAEAARQAAARPGGGA